MDLTNRKQVVMNLWIQDECRRLLLFCSKVSDINVSVLTMMVVIWIAQTLCLFDFGMWLLIAIHFIRLDSNTVC
jgi:hypothetical protein